MLENALSGWNSKLAEIWTLLTQTPETFKGGDIWRVITGVNNALVGVGYGAWARWSGKFQLIILAVTGGILMLASAVM